MGSAVAGEGDFAWAAHWTEIPRIGWKGEDSFADLDPYINEGRPVILENAAVVNRDTWTNEYLASSFGDAELLVKRSNTTKFRYFDEKKNTGGFEFREPLESCKMTFRAFLAEVQQIVDSGSKTRLYCQETMTGHEELAAEFKTWNWEWLLKNALRHQWGLPDSNEMFVGMREATTPLHFDERENLLLQIRGTKRVVVFPFVEYTQLYPFPVTHPCDRQSMVDLCDPNPTRFPKFQNASGQYTVLRDGDLLYIPYGWWHWLQNIDELAISMSFWSTTPKLDLSAGVPDMFTPNQLTRVNRNLETMIAQTVGAAKLPQVAGEIVAAVKSGQCHAILDVLRSMLTHVKVEDRALQDEFLLAMLDGRFDGDWDRWV